MNTTTTLKVDGLDYFSAQYTLLDIYLPPELNGRSHTDITSACLLLSPEY
jgi:hypothetical protein